MVARCPYDSKGGCEFYKPYYVVQKCGSGAFTPTLDEIDHRCRHPKVYPIRRSGELEYNGFKVSMMKRCPNV